MTEIIAALIRAQAAFDPVLKDATNPHFKNKYASLSSVLAATSKALADNGLAILQFPADGHHGPGLCTILAFENGETIERTTSIPLSKTDPQGWAAGITYARRYGLMAVLGLAAEDDDGNTATAAKAAAPKSTPASRRAAITSLAANKLGIAKPSKEQVAAVFGVDPEKLDDKAISAILRKEEACHV